MPVRKSAIKSVKQGKQRRLRNLRIISDLKTRAAKFKAFLAEKKKEEAKSALTDLISRIDKAKSKGMIRKNTASRKKSRLTKKLAQLTT